VGSITHHISGALFISKATKTKYIISLNVFLIEYKMGKFGTVMYSRLLMWKLKLIT